MTGRKHKGNADRDDLNLGHGSIWFLFVSAFLSIPLARTRRAPAGGERTNEHFGPHAPGAGLAHDSPLNASWSNDHGEGAQAQSNQPSCRHEGDAEMSV
jgi:hypothetical protein